MNARWYLVAAAAVSAGLVWAAGETVIWCAVTMRNRHRQPLSLND